MQTIVKEIINININGWIKHVYIVATFDRQQHQRWGWQQWATSS